MPFRNLFKKRNVILNPENFDTIIDAKQNFAEVMKNSIPDPFWKLKIVDEFEMDYKPVRAFKDGVATKLFITYLKRKNLYEKFFKNAKIQHQHISI